MAEALAAVPFDRAISSGVPRAHETAAAILAGRGIAIEDEPGFREMKAGRLRDVAPERRHAALVRVFETAVVAGAAFAGGETFAAFEARVLAAFERTCAALSGGVCCSSPMTASTASSSPGRRRLALGALAAFEQDMGCLNLIDLDMAGDAVERRIIRLMNYTPYDAVKSKLFLTSMEHVFGAYAAAPDKG